VHQTHEEDRLRAEGNQGSVTRLLEAVSEGDRAASEKLFPVVYDELRRLAQAVLSGERRGHTLQATALVHEAYVKLMAQESAGWKSRAEFMGIAAQAMRRILVDHARARNREKRGGGGAPVALSEAMTLYEERAVDLSALDDALTRLAAFDARKARLVELRFFGGLSMEDAAALLGVPLRTLERDWTTARAWLRKELQGAGL
jgi:RNA polymerase sigma-70 factor, ECF subfamily